MNRILICAPLLLAGIPLPAAEPDASMGPIQAVEDAKPHASAFKDAGRGKPLALRTSEEAGKYFDEAALAALEKSVNFEQQFVLVFAWRGSGQDKLEYAVAESFPEQIQFTIRPGRTRDLRPHVKVFALRSNVKWSVR